AETLILSGRVFRTGKPLRTFPGNALVQADVDDPLERLDAAGEFGRQAETAGQVDLVFARAAVADDDEAHAAFAAGLELRADRGKAALAAGKHGEALAELGRLLLDRLRRDQPQADAVRPFVGLDMQDHRLAHR